SAFPAFRLRYRPCARTSSCRNRRHLPRKPIRKELPINRSSASSQAQPPSVWPNTLCGLRSNFGKVKASISPQTGLRLEDVFRSSAHRFAMTSTNHHPVDPVKLEKLAEVAVKVGLQLQKGQDLVVTAPVVAMPLVRLIT